jgi:ketosteroid isomerase-like protein
MRRRGNSATLPLASIHGSHEGTGNAQLQAAFGSFMQAAGDYSFENHAYLADDEHGVVMQRGTMRRDGKTFSTDEVFVIHFRDGKISELWYVPVDQAGVDAWFSNG